jgi:hypothetical protein
MPAGDKRSMTRALALMLAALALLLPGGGAFAQSGARIVSSVSWVEEWDPVSGQWVRVAEGAAALDPAAFEPAVTTTTTSLPGPGSVTVTETIIAQPVRFIPAARAAPAAGARAAFGPFRVLDERRAALVASTDAASPEAFAAMLAAFPGLEVIEFVDAPGTSHDLANLRLGRAIRAAGLATHVPAGGSARSGAVELFLAGTRRSVDPGALFAVHSWRDELGREPADFAPEAPENRLYLDYYAEMGMTAEEARAFYAMTNSVPHAGALWMGGAEMARWIAPAARRIDLGPAAEDALRRALARSGAALAEGLMVPLRRPWPLPQIAAPAPMPAALPRLAYADLGAGLVDSGAAFP